MKLTYSQKLYYTAKAKLVIIPSLSILLGLAIFYFDISLLFKSAAISLGVVSFFSGYFIHPYLSKKIKIADQKFDAVYDKFETPLLKERDSAKRGMVGEKEILSWLTEILPRDQFMIIPNLVLPGHKADIDFVVIGPKGIFVFEVKNFTEKLFFTTEDYAYISKSGELIKLEPQDDPRGQLRWNVDRLEKYLAQNKVSEIKTKRALVFPEADSMIYLGSPAIYLIDNKEALSKFILDNPDDPRFTPEFCNKVAKLIKN